MLKPERVFRTIYTEKYNFREPIPQLFNVRELESLHIFYPNHPLQKKLEFVEESRTWFHRKFYSESRLNYFRNNRAVSKWHCDSGADYQHPEYEINFQLPVTKCFSTNARWIESSPSAVDFAPLEMEIGEFAQFDENKCKHGNKVNETRWTRIRFDFRVMELEKYVEKCICKIGYNGEIIYDGSYYKKYEPQSCLSH